MTVHRPALVLLAIVPLLQGPAAAREAQDPISQARQLYYSTYYEESLEVLDKLSGSSVTPVQLQAARECRAMCLLALNRAPEAEKIIEQMIETDPGYRPPAQSAPPALMMAFARTQNRVVPSLASDRFAKAKTDFDNKQYAQSSAGFELVLRLIKEAAAGSDNAVVPKLTEIENAASRLLIASRTAQDQKAIPPTKAVYRPTDPGVTPPVAIRQDIPSWSAGKLEADRFEGQIEIVIGSDGSVRSATIVAPIHPSYDPALLDAARKWRFRPASKEGRPVAYAETLTIRLASPKVRN